MQRKQLKQALAEITMEIQKLPFDHWEKTPFPVVSSRLYQGKEVMVEVDLLTKKADYLEIGVSVYGDDLLSPYFPVGTNIVVKRDCTA
jgi:hypothetical protein